MKKFLLIICVIASLAVASTLFVLPYALGMITQNKYTQLLDVFSKNTAAKITLLNYQRGWFSSEATVEVVLPPTVSITTAHTNTPSTMIVKQHIEHGPVFSLVANNGDKTLQLGEALINSHIGSSFGTADAVSWIKPDGTLWGSITTPLLHLANQSTNQSVEIKNLYGIFELSENAKQFVSNFSAKQIIIKTGKIEQHIDQVDFYCDLQKSASDLFLGKRLFTAHSLVWNTPLYSTPIKFETLQIQTHDQEQNHKMNHEIQIALKKIIVNNVSYGQQQLVLAINQLDIPILLALKNAFNHLPSSDLSAQTLAKHQQLFMTLLSKGLEIQLKKLQIITPWGNASLVANLTLPPQPTSGFYQLVSAANINAVANAPAVFWIRALEKFHEITQKIQFVVTESVPTQSANQLAQQQFTDWINKGWLLLSKENGYQLKISYQKQQTTINDQPLHPPVQSQSSPLHLSNNAICKNVQNLS